MGMKEDLKKFISECIICQKIKWQRTADWEDLEDRHLYCLTPLQESSIETLGTFPEDEFGMRYIILIVDNFLNFVGLYQANTISTLEFVRAFLSWVGIFGVPKRWSSEAMEVFNFHRIWRKDSKS